MSESKVVIIGSGIGGLASAIRMAARGLEVEVYEQASDTGGKVSELHHQGYRFDTGPSVLTLPELIDELFVLCGENPRDHFNYSKPELSCKYFWEDGSIIKAWQDKAKFAEEIGTHSSVSPQRLDGFLNRSRELYNITAETFIFNSIHKLANFKSGEYRNTLFNIHKLDPFVTMHKRNSRWFRDKKIVQLFDRYATYIGSSPFKTPATLNIISHLEHNLGILFPDKGIYDIAASLTSLAARHGVEFHLNTPVREIIHANGVIKGIRAENRFIPADIVISDTDVNLLYTELMPSEKIPPALVNKERSSSALVFFWGVGTINTQLELHNILFSDDYRNEFSYLFSRKEICSDPTVYIYISSRAVQNDAPQGCENWFVMVNAPENRGQYRDTLITETRRNIIAKINRILGTDIEKHILFEQITDPPAIEQRTGSFRGSLYGLSSNGMFSAFNRHPNFRKKYRNLFFTGGSVHPGGGIPMCLASAKIIDKEIGSILR